MCFQVEQSHHSKELFAYMFHFLRPALNLRLETERQCKLRQHRHLADRFLCLPANHLRGSSNRCASDLNQRNQQCSLQLQEWWMLFPQLKMLQLKGAQPE